MFENVFYDQLIEAAMAHMGPLKICKGQPSRLPNNVGGPAFIRTVTVMSNNTHVLGLQQSLLQIPDLKKVNFSSLLYVQQHMGHWLVFLGVRAYPKLVLVSA